MVQNYGTFSFSFLFFFPMGLQMKSINVKLLYVVSVNALTSESWNPRIDSENADVRLRIC